MPSDRSLFRSAPGRAAVGLSALASSALSTACTDKATGTGTGSATASASAVAYVDTALAFEDTVFYYRSRVNFPAQQSAVRDSLARTRSQGPGRDTLYYRPVDYSINPFLRDAGDEHSDFFRPSEAPGASDASPTDPRFQVSGYLLPASAGVTTGNPVGYVWYPPYTGTTPVGHIDSTVAVIRTLDQSSPCGYVLDLRFNYGGSIFPMMAGLAPLFGNAPASSTLRGVGGWVDYTQATTVIFLQNGAVGAADASTGYSELVYAATSPYTLKRANTPVAVLIDSLTASAGEFITLGFRGGPVPVRVFGEPSYGVTTTPYYHDFADGAFLNITAGVMMDRTGQLYGGKLTPDQYVVGTNFRSLLPSQAATTPDAVVTAAVAWLNTQPSCGGTSTAASAPSFSRDVTGTAPALKPGRGVQRVSRYWSSRGARAMVGARR